MNTLKVTVVPHTPFVEYVREFDAPVAAVYRAHADPALVERWLGPNGYTTQIDHWHLRTGGSYRFTHVDPEGESYEFHGVFHAARPNDLIIQTFEYDGYPDVVSIETLRFEDLGDGRTRLVGHSTYPSQEARDGMAASGMEEGMAQGYDRLDAVLAELMATR
ncbi:polyketide cyclase [Cryobacterium sp. TMT1-3]|uniref:Polyketide cyclase n=1 Tax=Cryobacterium luteum TaxID=1424661 RepID=A0A1H8HK99_9MICO|nr:MULTISPECIES: SRPBCC family protein [Cryobacterium]TFB86658.1 polyketide cyclase [Cryobacterium luteum]TFC26036.1 polyketide cyclase [Cryobacterium sp. TMT1-3]SEN55958.1 Uncharacterized conserved protein YndB, AHSA1/START domain [Cryobacterium luteum]